MSPALRTASRSASLRCRWSRGLSDRARDAPKAAPHCPLRRRPAAKRGAAAKPGERKLLYYRNPMGLADTSPVPKKDPMGMDYIAGLRRRGPGRTGYGEGVGRPDPDAGRAHRAGEQTVARARRARGRHDRDQRARPAHSRAEVRGLDREAARQHDRAGGRARPAAGGGLQPRTRVGAAGIPDRLQRDEEPERVRAPTRRPACSSWPSAALERLRNWDISEQQIAAAARRRRAAPHADAHRARLRRDRQGPAGGGDAVHAGRSAVQDRRPVARSG